MVKRRASAGANQRVSLVLGVPAGAFWPYFSGLSVLVVGLITILREEWSQARGQERVLLLGRLAFAVPMAVFGAEHFTATKDIASAIPGARVLQIDPASTLRQD